MPFDEASEWFLDPIVHFQEVFKLIFNAWFLCYPCFQTLSFQTYATPSLLSDWLFAFFGAFLTDALSSAFLTASFFQLIFRSSLKHLCYTKNCEESIRSSFVRENCALSLKNSPCHCAIIDCHPNNRFRGGQLIVAVAVWVFWVFIKVSNKNSNGISYLCGADNISGYLFSLFLSVQ